MRTDGNLQPNPSRTAYAAAMQSAQSMFLADPHRLDAGAIAVHARAAAVDAIIQSLWRDILSASPFARSGVSLVAVGGYGRAELFPSSDVDLLFLLDASTPEPALQDPIRRINQSLWDCGMRVAPMTRTLAECGAFDPENVEFTLALLDARHVAGDPAVTAQLTLAAPQPALSTRDRRKCIARLLALTRARHTRFGDTIFHLEPNVKDGLGGLRDAHVAVWLARLTAAASAPSDSEFDEARKFLLLTRVFLHLRHGRDENTLDWQAQDEAAALPLGAPARPAGSAASAPDAAYWMRLYFRHARAVARCVAASMEAAGPAAGSSIPALAARSGRNDPAHDPDLVLQVFATMARSGASLPSATESRFQAALPHLSAHLEDGPGLWRHLKAILTGPFAGRALRAMHSLGILELLLPEFHGIDALVIRDAYHRYTVDEHTFVLIDTLHALAPSAKASTNPQAGRFASILRDLPHPELLFLAALLHDTGKGHSTGSHAAESARMAGSVCARLDIDPYETGLVLDLIRNHLEMSAALRRDVFDRETVRSFSAHVPTPEALRMLTLFTYADIAAVHPDALTPWKAENIWRLYLATSNFLDRNVDDERVGPDSKAELAEVIHRVHALLPKRRAEVSAFLEGLPSRYLLTRTPDDIRTHVEMFQHLDDSPESSNAIDFRYAPGMSELTLITRDRPVLFASVAGALAAWGMNIITADAFSNAASVVVDTFRFTDPFRTLELNESERTRFLASIRDVVSAAPGAEATLAARRRGRRKAAKVTVETRISFDRSASTQSTLLEVIAQDNPGLLRALSLPIAEHGCNIEVALIDTEGEMAIDVFYLTRSGAKLDSPTETALGQSLLEAIARNVR